MATVRFIGGNCHALIQVIPEEDLTQFLQAQSTYWTKLLADGSTHIVDGGRKDSFWHSYNVDIYEKQLLRDSSNNFIYEYVRTQEIPRCSALTKKKTRCLHAAKLDENYCLKHMEK